MRNLNALVAAALIAPGCAAPEAVDLAAAGDAVLAQAFESRASNLQVEGAGTVQRLLRDDHEGARHQRFLVRLASGQTLLVAHNIDVAPRIPLAEGDPVAFSGEYEWNQQGGVLHWTHRTDSGPHPHGWVEHAGRRYD